MTEQANKTPNRNAAQVRRAKARRRWLINIAVIVVVVGAGAGLWWSRRSRSDSPAGLVTGTATRRDLTETVSATGSVTAQTGAMVKIGSQITGRIKRLYADVGDQMKAGEVIAELDVPDLNAQVRQTEATLALNRSRLTEQTSGVALQDTQTATDIDRAQAGVALAQTSLNQAQQTANLQTATAEATLRQAQANATNSSASLARTQQLFDKGYVAAADVDNAKAQAEVNAAQVASAQQNVQLVRAKVEADLASARDQLRQAQSALAASQAGTAQPIIKRVQVQEAQATVRQSEAALAQSRAQFDKAFIRTPIAGTVIQLAQQQGETIAAGLSAPTVIIVADLDRLQVDAFVDETDIGHVELGQPAVVTVDAYPSHPFPGRVEKIASGSTMQQNVVTYDVTIALDNPGRLLKPDMTASVTITIGGKQDALVVPIDTIKPTPQGPTVVVQTKDTKGQPSYRTVQVKTGISDGDYTEIQRGLQAGDVVVLAGQVPGVNSQQTAPRFRGGPLGLAGGGGGGRGGRGGL